MNVEGSDQYLMRVKHAGGKIPRKKVRTYPK